MSFLLYRENMKYLQHYIIIIMVLLREIGNIIQSQLVLNDYVNFLYV